MSLSPFIDTLLLFIYLMALFYYKIVDKSSDKYLLHKLIIFIFVLAFRYILEILKDIVGKVTIDTGVVFNNALIYALLAVIGYCVYRDLVLDGWFVDSSWGFMIASGIIALFGLSGDVIKFIFN